MNETGYLLIIMLPLSIVLLFTVIYHLWDTDRDPESELEKASGDNEDAAGRIEELERLAREAKASASDIEGRVGQHEDRIGEAEAAAAELEGRFEPHADRIREADVYAGAAEQANLRIEGHYSEAEDLLGQSLAILEEIKKPK